MEQSEEAMAMWNFAELSDQELMSPKSVTDAQRRYIVQMEAEAGLHPNVGKKD